MAKRNSRNETDNASQLTPETALEIFIRHVYTGRITIYHPRTGKAYNFDTLTEAADLIYTGYFSEDPR